MNKVGLIPYYILTFCILHNACLMNVNEFQYPANIENRLNNLGALDPNRNHQLLGVQKRNFLNERIVI